MNHRVREFAGIAAASVVAPEESALEIISGAAFAGKKVEADSIHVRSMLLCHDQYDRTYERFPKEYLERFAETGPGKSLLACHDTGWAGQNSLPMGRFFSAEVVRKIEEIAVPVSGRRRIGKSDDGGEAKTADMIPPGFESKRKTIHFLDASFYFAATDDNEGLRSNIDLGVFKHVSIGYSYDDLFCDICKESYLRSGCPHILGYEYEGEDGKFTLATGTYSGDPMLAEMREGSIVYLGAQQGSRMKADGRVDPKALAYTPWGEDLVALKEGEYLASIYGSDRRIFAVSHEDLVKGHVGLSLEDHSTAVLDAAEGLITRYEGLSASNQEKKPDVATTLPAKHGERLQPLQERLGLLLEKCAPLDAAPVKEATERQLWELDQIRRRARARA